jgi:hypothetical protein
MVKSRAFVSALVAVVGAIIAVKKFMDVMRGDDESTV